MKRREGDYLLLTMSIGGVRRKVLAHRAAFAIVHGRWPEDELDHMRHDGADNRMSELREATHLQNTQNKRLPPPFSGLRGVYWDRSRGKWLATISRKNKSIFLGRFDDKHEASETYLAARRALFDFHPQGYAT